MKISRSLKRSFTDFKRHPWLHFVSISTITISLVIVGIFFLLYTNFENLSEKTNPAITGTVYLKEELNEQQMKKVKEKILSFENVRAVAFKPKKKVVEELQGFLGSSGSEMVPGIELFPDVFEISVSKETTSQGIAVLKGIIGQLPEISEVDFSDDWLAQYKKVRQLLTIAGFVLMFVIVVACSFMIANFMGMRHQSRKNEIEIVGLIGANRNFILTPFLWEGVIEGIVSSSLALILLVLGKAFLNTLIQVHWSSLFGNTGLVFLSMGQGITIVFLGLVTALFGGFTVFLRFQSEKH